MYAIGGDGKVRGTVTYGMTTYDVGMQYLQRSLAPMPAFSDPTSSLLQKYGTLAQDRTKALPYEDMSMTFDPLRYFRKADEGKEKDYFPSTLSSIGKDVKYAERNGLASKYLH